MTVVWRLKDFYKANAQKVYDEVNSIGEEYTPKDIVDYAREYKKSELHKCFEWNDEIAGEKYRIIQARNIVRNLVVTVSSPDKPEEVQQVRVIVNSGENDKIYRPVTVTVRNDDQYAALLKQAKLELDAFRKRYKAIRELEGIIEEIDRLI